MKNTEPIQFGKLKILTDPDDFTGESEITPEIKKKLASVLKKVFNKNILAETELNNLINEYPKIPQFKNYLSMYFILTGDKKKASELNQLISKVHPSFLFGKINLAIDFLDSGNIDKVPEILGGSLDLNSLYPDRDTYHLNEFLSYYSLAAEYFLKKDNIEEAEKRLNIMKDTDPENQKTKITDILIRENILKINFSKVISEFKKPVKTQKKKYDQISTPPEFENYNLNILYNYGFDIDFSMISTLLDIPRDSLIKDLEMILTDGIVRYKYFKKMGWNEETHSFPLHALLLLKALKAQESLDVILEFLSQKKEFMEFWLSDFLTEGLYDVIYETGINKLDSLRNFMLEEKIYLYPKTAVSEAVSMITFDHPERKNEVIEWYYFILNYFLLQKKNNILPEPDFIGLVLCDVINIKAMELESTIIKLFDRDIVDPGVTGYKEDYLRDFHSNRYKSFRRNSQTIEETYALFKKLETDNKKFISKQKEEKVKESQTKVYPSLPDIYRNVGRNEKCPCGSGLKFKKCHGKNVSTLD